jgi:serine/threonine protein kinase
MTSRAIRQIVSHDDKILEKLGSGGIGDLYVAEDEKLSRRVALEILPLEMASAERGRCFEREANAVVAFNHPNTKATYGSWTWFRTKKGISSPVVSSKGTGSRDINSLAKGQGDRGRRLGTGSFGERSVPG